MEELPLSDAYVSESLSPPFDFITPTLGRSLKRFLADFVCSFSSKGSSMHYPRYGTINSAPPGCCGKYSAIS